MKDYPMAVFWKDKYDYGGGGVYFYIHRSDLWSGDMSKGCSPHACEDASLDYLENLKAVDKHFTRVGLLPREFVV